MVGCNNRKSEETESVVAPFENTETVEESVRETKQPPKDTAGETEPTKMADPTDSNAKSEEKAEQASPESKSDTEADTEKSKPEHKAEEAPKEESKEEPVQEAPKKNTDDSTKQETEKQEPEKEPEKKQEISYSPQNVVSLATAKTKAAGKVLLTENLDRLLAEGQISKGEYSEYYPYDGAGYFSVFVQTDLNQASTTSGRKLGSEDAIAQYIAELLALESGPYFLIEYAGTYNNGGTNCYEFRCYRA